MTPAAKTTIRLVLFLAAASLRAQDNSQDAMSIAADTAVRRQAATVELELKLQAATNAWKRSDVLEAAKNYEAAVVLFPSVEVGNPRVDNEKMQAILGLDATREILAREYLKAQDYGAAANQVSAALKFDPNNEKLRLLKIEIDNRLEAIKGHIPDQETLNSIPDMEKRKQSAATLVQDGKLLYEMGRLNDAEKKLLDALALDPGNAAAPYYLDLLKEARYINDSRNRERDTKTELETVEKTWLLSTKAESLPVPNPYATNKNVYTSPGRKTIMQKLREIKLVEMDSDFEKGLPLSEVLGKLHRVSVSNDLENIGINFMFKPRGNSSSAQVLDPTAPAPAPADPTTINIKISPTLNNVTLEQALDAICQVADDPTGLTYSVEDYAVWFYVKPPESAPFETRKFHVDPNTFMQGLQGVTTSVIAGSGGQTGGNSGGGGGNGGGGGGFGGGGGGGGLGGGGGGLGGGGGGLGGGLGGGGGGLGGGLGGGGQGGGGQGGGIGAIQGGAIYPSVSTSALPYITRTNLTSDDNVIVANYFGRMGITLTNNGSFVFFNIRTGDLLVRSTPDNLDVVEKVVQLLNAVPPELQIDTKFASVTQNDAKGLGFQWDLGNTTINNGAIGGQAGTAPSYQGNPTLANPSGIFPGAGPSGSNPGQIAPSASDGSLTGSALRTVAPGAPSSAPALATLGTVTGILTDPQFRFAIQAIEQRDGADILSAPRVTTESGRQAHVSVDDIVDIVTAVTLGSTAAGGVGGTTAAGGLSSSSAVAASSSYTTTPFTEGPALDILPTISADGYSIQMVLIPSLAEFVGYDSPGQFIPQSQSVAGSSIGVPITATLPLPHYRVRQVVTSVNVWDGQTILLGGLIAENIAKSKDKIPVLGDLPLLGRLFQSQYSYSQKQNLMVFVTSRIIDPAGNPLHADGDMPFATNSVPPQPVIPPSAR